MDIRDPIFLQLREHIATIRRLSEMETPAALVWAEVSLYLREAAIHLETFVLPKIEMKTPHVDLRGTAAPKIAEFVGSTQELEDAIADDVGGSIFLRNGGQR